MPNLAKVCDRCGISDRAAALVATSTLCDVGIVTSHDSSRVIDRSKIRHPRSQLRAFCEDDDISGVLL